MHSDYSAQDDEEEAFLSSAFCHYEIGILSLLDLRLGNKRGDKIPAFVKKTFSRQKDKTKDFRDYLLSRKSRDK